MQIKLSNFKVEKTSPNFGGAVKEADIVGYISDRMHSWCNARAEAEQMWLMAWSQYLPSYSATQWSRNTALYNVGRSMDWRHRVNCGKAYELVEQVHSILYQATFPNDNWLRIVPSEPGYMEIARVMTRYMKQKLTYDWHFKREYSASLRQMIITGNTAMEISWRNGDMFFKTLDIFEIFVPPTAENSGDDKPIARKLWLTRADVAEKIRSGEYTNVTLEEISQFQSDSAEYFRASSDKVKHFAGIQVGDEYSWNDKVSITEWWGCVHLPYVTIRNVHCILLGNARIVSIKPNNYKCGVPIVMGTFIPVVRQPYGIGTIQPVQGLIHTYESMVNQRLDNVELLINQMFEVVDDGVVDIEEVYSEPGKAIKVAQKGTVTPIPSGTNPQIAYAETSRLNADIDRTMGAGAYLGAGAPRDAERVTRAEIEYTRQSGGNRLTSVFSDVSSEFLSPILFKCLKNLQQFQYKEELIDVPSRTEPGGVDYIAIGREELALPYKIIPMGAEHVAERDEYIRKRMEFLALVSQNEMLAQLVNFEKLLLDLLNNWGFDDPESYLAQPEPEPETEPEQSIGDNLLGKHVNRSMMTDGGQSIANQFGIPAGQQDIAAALAALGAGAGGAPVAGEGMGAATTAGSAPSPGIGGV